jgi:transposase-like protein
LIEHALAPDRRSSSIPRSMAKAKVKRAPAFVAGSEGRRQFSEAAKRRIVGEANRPGGSLSEVARRYDIGL